jgi:TRAP-type transport system periplasmic protein
VETANVTNTVDTVRRAYAQGMALALCLLVSFPIAAQAEVRWLMATEYPQSNISGVALATFGRLVTARTRGFVTTTNAFDNEMKIGSGDLVAAAKSGRVAGGDAFAGPMEAVDPVFGLPSLPFVAQSVDEAKAVNARARPLYEKALKAQGQKLLFITIWPATGLWSDRPVKAPDDLKALAVRAYDYNSASVFQLVGATAEYLPFNEAIARVKERKLNAIVTSGDGGAGRKLWDDLRHFTAINYAIPISITFVREADFENLPADVQAQVMEAAAESEKSQYELLTTRTVENYRRMEENGVTIQDPAPPAVLVPLKAAAQEIVNRWKAKVPEEAAAIVDWANKR